MLVLLDRDGVINVDRPDSVKSVAECEMIEGSVAAVARLNKAGFNVALVTNQSAVGKGWISQNELDDIHHYMREQLKQAGAAIDAIYVCTDHPDQPTHRRKPAPGMIEEALADFNAQAEQTPLVGDALRDMQAAAVAGCPRYLVRTGKGQKTLDDGLPDACNPIKVMDDLAQAADDIIRRYGGGA